MCVPFDIYGGSPISSCMARRRSASHAALSRRVQLAFGKRLKRSRKLETRGRIKQAGLAKALDVSRTSISNMERGRHRVFLDQVYAAAQVLGTTIEELLPTLDEAFPPTPVTASASTSITDKSMRSAADLVRTIQERAVIEYARQDAQSSETSQS